ncbi:hypothetical protein dsx2_0193 [Desulfovibrio sp. X2]|uniref:urease accessory protein UreH domain-containing protein n=1 Tax=Desulfovibrio sp. X2 TaxID=941449 RepID=UPI000358771F|nr:sulfite exporter TauE/SafE family protein [Desulfovibrio sp. X2]EPR42266.1 hypothetical protein dsx2_0193 [Desulfovibrio sp. X2]
MHLDSLFLVALQSSLALGLVHGVNPCGHSWVVLAPFVACERSGRRVAWLTAAFSGGTAVACLLIGLTLGAVAGGLPPHFRQIMDLATAVILVAIGAVLLVRPTLLHSHDHCEPHACATDDHDHEDHHDHDHDHEHHHGHHHHHEHGLDAFKQRLARFGALGLFTVGLVNMIVPCPTVAIMYSYALKSGDPLRATLVFAAYALGTALALAGVIWALHSMARFARNLDRPWIEPLIMRVVGLVTVAFGIYSYLGEYTV